MRKNVSAFLVFLFIAMAFSFVGCKKQASTTSSAAKTPVASAPATTAQPVAKASEPTKQADVKAIVFRVGHKSSANSSWQKGAEYWGKLLEEKSNGTMKIEVYPNSQLGDQKEMTEMAQLGVLDVVLNAPATLSNFMKDISALDLPFLFRNYQHAFDCMDSCVLDYYAKEYESIGLVCLSNWDTGFKNLSNSRRPLKSISDIKGLKIRYAGGAALSGTIEILGASAVSIPWSETYIALSQGTADAQFNPASTMVESKIHEVQKYYSNIPIQYGAEPVTMSLKTWKKLTPEQQKIVRETCIEAGKYQREVSQQMDKDALKTMIDYGCVYTEVTPEVLKQIQEATSPLLQKYCPADLLKAIQAR